MNLLKFSKILNLFNSVKNQISFHVYCVENKIVSSRLVLTIIFVNIYLIRELILKKIGEKNIQNSETSCCILSPRNLTIFILDKQEIVNLK